MAMRSATAARRPWSCPHRGRRSARSHRRRRSPQPPRRARTSNVAAPAARGRCRAWPAPPTREASREPGPGRVWRSRSEGSRRSVASSSWILRPVGDRRVQPFRREMHAGLDRAGGDAEAIGDVIDAEVEVEPQRDDDPVIAGQALERAVKDKAVIDAAQSVGGLAVVAFGLDLDDGSAALAAQSVTTRVDEDALEPGFEP